MSLNKKEYMELRFLTGTPLEDHDAESWARMGALTEKLGSPSEPPPENTIHSLFDPTGEIGSQITIHPNADGEWVLFIPATQPEHYEGYDPEVGSTNFDGAAILGPWGDTNWSSLRSAVDALSLSLRGGDIKYNDGRIVE